MERKPKRLGTFLPLLVLCALLPACGGGGGGGGSPTEGPGSLAFSSAAFSVNQAADAAAISVMRTGGSTGSATVQYATSDGTAVAGTDYAAASGTLTWASGESGARTIPVTILNHTSAAGRTVVLTLSGFSGATPGAVVSATLTITGDLVWDEGTWNSVQWK